jgi:signal transduction histidine kinase/CheY-like chemotaxis protein
MAVREQDEVLGLAQLTLSPQQVLSWLRSLQPGPGRELLIVDRQAQVIASTDPARQILAPIALPGLALALAGERGEASFQVGGAERLLTYAHVPRGAWALFVIDDPAIVLAPERALHATVGVATAGAAVAATIMGVVLGIFVLALRRQRAELAEASRYKSEFLTRMSHELRTPMNAILGFSELLGERPAEALSDRQKRYVRSIRDAGDHLLELINNVLDLAKVDAGRVELQLGVIPLGQLLEPVVAGTRRAAAEAGVRFDVVAQDAAVRLDASRMRQVLYNLLSNAVKFTPREGRVLLSAGLDGSELFVDVSDTGMGIPADKHDRVFGTFERLHKGKSHAPGTGLGLALTKELVELHGGTISFESEEGQGTIFHVRLAGAAAQLVAGHRILVVEDESGDADLIVELAAAAGLRCEVVGSARSALAAAQRNRPLAVVLDLRLPDERGESVLAALKASPASRSIPVLVVSVDEDDGGARRLGADDYLTKPIDRARLGAWLIRAAATDLEYAPAGV